ncbi:MAG: CDP-alcohol phosphatidyltransferase family protein [Bacteroidales bacterium OttesenSCG-928-I14]|jgi:hypothetical protein|nr:CDP-alcohol phosphatidyltransferase family protein [Bacteroidales bacterium OttesenSCG-928-I14]
MKDKLIDFESTLKSVDTEEFLDIYFYRPIGYYLALFFLKIGILPNHVTVISMFLGVAAGICFYFQNLYAILFGMFLLVLANSFDSADGQLARMTNNKSFFGRVLDGLSGVCWFVSIYISIICRSEWNAIFFLAGFSGFYHLKQTAMADYYRNLHLLFLKGNSGSEFDNSKKLFYKYKQISWKEYPFYKFISLVYLNYTKKQEMESIQLQNLLIIIDTKYNGNPPVWLREGFCKKSLPLIKYTNLLSFNLRSIVLFFCLLTNYSWVYFIFELTIMNVILFYMVECYERICQNYLNKI